MRKAVYFFCTDYERDEVAPRVLNYLKEVCINRNRNLKLCQFQQMKINYLYHHDIHRHLYLQI